MSKNHEVVHLVDSRQFSEFVRNQRLLQTRPQDDFDKVSQSELSKIENGYVTPRLSSVLRVVEELGYILILQRDPMAPKVSRSQFKKITKECARVNSGESYTLPIDGLYREIHEHFQ